MESTSWQDCNLLWLVHPSQLDGRFWIRQPADDPQPIGSLRHDGEDFRMNPDYWFGVESGQYVLVADVETRMMFVIEERS